MTANRYNNLLKTSAISTTMAVFLVFPSISNAQSCTITSGGGTLAVPTNGSVIDCAANQTSTTAIGDRTTDATVNLGAGSFLDISAGTFAIELNKATVTLDEGAKISGNPTNTGAGIYTKKALTLTLGKNARIDGGFGVYSNGGNSIITLGEDSQINGITSTGLNTNGRPVITLGERSQINAGTIGIKNGVGTADKKAVITLGKDSQINAGTNGIDVKYGNIVLNSGAKINAGTNGIKFAILGNSLVTLDKGSSIIGANIGILGVSGGNDIVDTSGYIEGGGGTAIDLQNGTNQLILRTGSVINGSIKGGSGTDTLTIYGTGSEDDNFTLFDAFNFNGNDWTISGTSTFGTTTLNSGKLTNNGSITSDVNIGALASFGGTGTTTGNITNDGNLTPGNSIGTLNIVGNYSQNAGADLAIEFDSANSDLLNITGSATLDGGVSFTEIAGGTLDGTTYTFLQTTGGIAGSFSSINNPLFFTSNVNIGANNATVTLNRIKTVTAASNSSEQAVADSLDSILASNPSSIAEIDTILNSLSDNAAASDFLASQSGNVMATSMTSTTSAIQQVGTVVQSRFSSPSGGSSSSIAGASFSASSSSSNLSSIAPAAGGDDSQSNNSPMGLKITPLFKPEKTAWVEVSGGLGKVNSDSNARGMSYRNFSTTAGIETDLNKDVKIGAFGSFSRTNGKVKGLDDKSRTDIYQAGLYGSKKLDNSWRLNGSAATSFLNFNTTRNTAIGTAEGKFKGIGAYAQAEALYDIPISNGWVSPFIGLESSIIHHQSYTEKGAGALNLSIESNVVPKFASKLGLEVRKTYFNPLGETRAFNILSLARLSWAHEFTNNNTTSQVSFASNPASLFTSQGPEKKRDSLRFKLSTSFAGSDDGKISGYINYDANVTTESYGHSITTGLRIRW